MATTTTSSANKKSSSANIISNLANLLPTGTFLAFQAIAPVFTNNGHCGLVEKIMTGIFVFTFSAIAFILTLTDSITTTSGKHYFGLITPKGLYNPQFKGSTIVNVKGSYYTGGSRRYKASIFDFINAVLNVVVLSVLALFTPPVSTCYYPHMSSTIIKSVPVLVGILVSLYFSFAPSPRHGVGYSASGLTPDPAEEHEAPVSDGPPTKEGAGTPGEKKKADIAAPSPDRSTAV